MREVKTTLDALKSRIPVLSKDLLPRRDIFGQPITLEGALGPDIVSSIYTSREKNDPAVNEMIALGVTPGRIGKKVEGVELTPEEYDRLQVDAGAALRGVLDSYVNIPGWSSLPEFVRKEAFEKAIATTRAQARKAMTMDPGFAKRRFEAMQKDIERKLGQVSE